MGLGVLDAPIPPGHTQVPGTATLDDLDSQNGNASTAHSSLKRTPDGKIILIPQPTSSPSDPLNWPLWRRDVITAILCLASVIATTLSPLLAATSLDLSVWFLEPFPSIALLTGYHLLGVGLAGFLFVPTARVLGKRHLYLLGTVLVIISSAWGGGSGKNYKSFLAARFFQGVGLAPFEALVNATVGDLYFVHERGKRMAVSNLSLFGGAFFTPVIVGKMARSLGWQWTFYFVAIFMAVMLPFMVFFMPETAFERGDEDQLRMAWVAAVEFETAEAKGEPFPSNSLDKEPDDTTTTLPHSPATTTVSGNPPPILSNANLGLFHGRKNPAYFLVLLLRPFPLFFQPAILWAMLIQGAMIGWTVFIGIVLAAIMIGPPLLFDEVKTGYLYTGAFIGALLGFILSGLLADSVPKYMAKKNGGVFEPEFRLVLVIPQLVFGCAGLYGFGITSADVWSYGWFWPDFFFALEVMGMVLGAVASALYIVDAHKDIAVEGFTCLLVFKNIFSFGLTYSGYGWLLHGGIRNTFVAISSVQVVICCLTVLMYVFGKKNRSFFARHDILQMLYLK